MKIDLFYNDFIKNIEININDKIGTLQENILSNSMLLIYNIEYSNIIINGNIYILGSDDLLFDTTLFDFLKNNNTDENNIEKIIIYDRKRDETGNVIKDNYIIERYNQWYINNENNNYFESVNNYPQNRNTLRLPIDTLLRNILNIQLNYTQEYINEVSINDQSIDDQPINDQSIDDQPINDQSINNQPINDQSINDQPINDQSINDQPINDQSINDQPINDQSINTSEINIPMNNNENINDIINFFDNFISNYSNNIFLDRINQDLSYIASEYINISELNNTDYNDLPDLIDDNNNVINNVINNNYEDIKIVLNEDQFNKLDSFYYKDKCCECSDECLICIENFEDESHLVKLNCNHVFHKNCIKNWICNENNKCPICRIEIDKGNIKK